MLALSDGALACVCVAATAVAPAARAAWLKELAARLERPADPPTAGSGYTRRWRARQRNGQILLRVVVDEAAVAVAAVEHGLLNPLHADDRAALAAAAERALLLFGESSPPEPAIRATVQTRLMAAIARKETDARLPPTSRSRARAPARRGRKP